MQPPAFVGVAGDEFLNLWSGAKALRCNEISNLVWLKAFAVAHRSPKIVALCEDARLRTWTIERVGRGGGFRIRQSDVRRLQRTRGQASQPTEAIFSPDDQWLLTRQHDGSLIVWTAEGKPVVGHLRGHRGPVTDMCFVGDRLVTASADTTILIWDWPALATLCGKAVEAPAAGDAPAVSAAASR
jgi:WD40 repeat protein